VRVVGATGQLVYLVNTHARRSDLTSDTIVGEPRALLPYTVIERIRVTFYGKDSFGDGSDSQLRKVTTSLTRSREHASVSREKSVRWTRRVRSNVSM